MQKQEEPENWTILKNYKFSDKNLLGKSVYFNKFMKNESFKSINLKYYIQKKKEELLLRFIWEKRFRQEKKLQSKES